MITRRLFPPALALLAACGGPQDPLDGRLFSTRGERTTDFSAWLDDAPAGVDAAPELLLERVTSGVPWPRGLAFVEGELYVLARGRHRRSGGLDPAILDRSGDLFRVDPDVVEPVVEGRPAGDAVRANKTLVAAPDPELFQLYDPASGPPLRDTRMDRPYCTLVHDPLSRNLFICGYSGVDLPGGRFRKNATDSVHRFDLRTGRWESVELHDGDVVPAAELSYTVDNTYYPHHDPETSAPPHGWLNGPNGAEVVGDFLYVVSKDNHRLVQYDLAGIRADPTAPPPPSRPVLGSAVRLELDGELVDVVVHGHSAVAAHDGWLYLGYRTSSVVLRYPLTENGDLDTSRGGQLIGVFEPWSPEKRTSDNLMDIAFSPAGELHVATATKGRIWNLGVPDPARVFDGRWSSGREPWIDLRALTARPRARVGNMAFDEAGRLYFCSGNYAGGAEGYGLPGVIFRATLVQR